MRLALAITALAVLSGANRFDRPDRRDRISTRIQSPPTVAASTGLWLELAPASGAGMPAECSGGTVTGSRGQAITFARSGVAMCMKADYTWVSVASGAARTTVGETGQTQLGLMLESGSTNSVLRNRDLSNAGVWATSDVTCVKDATGIDGSANSASTCTASGGSGAVWQTVTASGTRATSFFIKRVTGTGTIRVTREGGGGWIDITSDISSSWKRFQPQSCGNETRCVQKTGLSSNFTNPVIGWEFGTSGDAIAIDFVQDEAKTYASSPIETAASATARAGEDMRITNPSGDFSNFCYAATVRPELLNESYIVMLEDGTSRSDFSTSNANGSVRFEFYWGGTSTASSAVGWTANTPGTWHRVSAKWNGTLPYAGMDGSYTAGTKAGGANPPSTMTLLRIGSGAFANTSTQGVMKSIEVDTTATGCTP
jgi:hypothetical protein